MCCFPAVINYLFPPRNVFLFDYDDIDEYEINPQEEQIPQSSIILTIKNLFKRDRRGYERVSSSYPGSGYDRVGDLNTTNAYGNSYTPGYNNLYTNGTTTSPENTTDIPDIHVEAPTLPRLKQKELMLQQEQDLNDSLIDRDLVQENVRN